jgi:LuxR family transcriptional regulator, maltose regulon positive regulatory protein
MESLLPSKLAVPRLPERRIGRERPTELLDGAFEAKLVLFSAPAGFGKTTTLVDWLNASGAAYGWLSLDEADNDPARFLRYLWAAVSSAGLDHSGEVGPAPNVTDIPPADVVDEIVVALARNQAPAVLVLDDYHVIEAAAVHRAVVLLLDHLPAQAHLAIATRVDPPLPLARLRARGELVELRADALRFTVAEARRFLAERMGVQLSDPDLETLVRRAEGWPAALQLAGLSLVDAVNAAQFVHDFAGTNRFVLDFISEELLAHLEPADHEFLLRTSLLDRLTGDLCDAVTGQTEGCETLERLERSNMLIVPLDDERRWFRYHRLFADLLRARQARLHSAEAPGLDARAAAWYEAHGFARDAIEHALRSGDLALFRALFHSHAHDFIYAGELSTVKNWLDRLPDRVVREDAGHSVAYAWLLVLAGQVHEVEARLEDAEKALASLGPAAAEHASLPSQIENVRSFLSGLSGDLPAAVTHAERAVELVPPGRPEGVRDMLTGMALGANAEALLAAGELDRAIEVFRKARPLMLRVGNRLEIARFTGNAARIELARGRFGAALEVCNAALEEWPAANAADEPATAPIHLARAEALERLGDAGASEVVAMALELATRGGDVATMHEARDVLQRLQARSRERAGAGPHARRTPGEAAPLVESLTERELEVLRLVAAGRSNRQIAAELYLALGTVKAHTHTIFGKLGVVNRVEAIVRARELGLL